MFETTLLRIRHFHHSNSITTLKFRYDFCFCLTSITIRSPFELFSWCSPHFFRLFRNVFFLFYRNTTFCSSWISKPPSSPNSPTWFTQFKTGLFPWRPLILAVLWGRRTAEDGWIRIESAASSAALFQPWHRLGCQLQSPQSHPEARRTELRWRYDT